MELGHIASKVCEMLRFIITLPALALLIFENNCIGIKDIVKNGPLADKKKKIKTKYTCKGHSRKGDGGGRVKKADGGHG